MINSNDDTSETSIITSSDTAGESIDWGRVNVSEQWQNQQRAVGEAVDDDNDLLLVSVTIILTFILIINY